MSLLLERSKSSQYPQLVTQVLYIASIEVMMGQASDACTKEEHQENIGNILIRLTLLKLRFNYSMLRRRTLQMQQYSDLLIDALLDEGFTVDEAKRLIQMREAYEEQQATQETNHHRFVRWLIEHGRLSDWQV